MTEKPKVAFVCVHNSCRSQMAEAIAKKIAAHMLEVYSAGTQIKDRINPLAVQAIWQLYRVDIEKMQYPKLLDALPPVDIVVSMGCGVSCPNVACKLFQDWQLSDPTGSEFQVYLNTAKQIETKIKNLICEVKLGLGGKK